MRPRLRMAGVALAAAMGLFGAAGVAAAAPQQEDMKARHAEMKARQDSMTTRHEDMMARMTGLDARIQRLAQEMNSSSGDARINAMAALLTAVVEQNQTMRSAMTEMKGGMTDMMEMCMMSGKAESSTAPSHDTRHAKVRCPTRLWRYHPGELVSTWPRTGCRVSPPTYAVARNHRKCKRRPLHQSAPRAM